MFLGCEKYISITIHIESKKADTEYKNNINGIVLS